MRENEILVLKRTFLQLDIKLSKYIFKKRISIDLKKKEQNVQSFELLA